MQFLICMRSEFEVEIVEKTLKVAKPHVRYRLYKLDATLLVVVWLLHHSSGLYAFVDFSYILYSLSCLNVLCLWESMLSDS